MNLRAERWLVPGIALFAVALHLATAGVYGIFRDEYYYIACSKRLAWGYVDHPPFSIAVLALSRALFGEGQFALRIVPALCAGLSVLFGGLIARAMGGKAFAQGLAALSFLVAPVFLGVGSFFSMNVLDHVFWAAAVYVLVRLIQSGNGRWWLVFGAVCGFGLLNKISVLFLGFGLVAGLVLTPQRKQLRDWRLYAGGAIALLIFLPHLVWQQLNGWPTLEFTRNAALYKNAPVGPVGFFLSQLLMINPVSVPLWLLGVGAGLFTSSLKPFRLLAWAFVAVYLLLSLTYGKDYYLAPAYFMVMPLAALYVEEITATRARFMRVVIPALQVASLFLILPAAMPVFPVETFLSYQRIIGLKAPAAEKNQVGQEIPQHIADRLGWEDLAKNIRAAADTLTPEQRAQCVVITSNYGEAYSLEYFQAAYNLPTAITGHNNGYLWGPGGASGEVVIAFNVGTPEQLGKAFTEIRQIGFHSTPYGMTYENNIPIYLCSKPKQALAAFWPNLKHFI